jgi:hypothetical protein
MGNTNHYNIPPGPSTIANATFRVPLSDMTVPMHREKQETRKEAAAHLDLFHIFAHAPPNIDLRTRNGFL